MARIMKQGGVPDHLKETIPQGAKPADMQGGVPSAFRATIRAAEQAGEESTEAGAEGQTPTTPQSNGALEAACPGFSGLIPPPNWNVP